MVILKKLSPFMGGSHFLLRKHQHMYKWSLEQTAHCFLYDKYEPDRQM